MKSMPKVIIIVCVASLIANGIFLNNFVNHRREVARHHQGFFSQVNYYTERITDNLNAIISNEYDDLNNSLNYLAINLRHLNQEIDAIQRYTSTNVLHTMEFQKIASTIQYGKLLTETTQIEVESGKPNQSGTGATVELIGNLPPFGDNNNLSESEITFLRTLKEDIEIIRTAILGTDNVNVKDDLTIKELTKELRDFSEKWRGSSPLNDYLNPFDILQ